MEGLSLHLPPVIPDSYYDISTHNTGYHPYSNTSNSAWTSRDDSGRGYQTQGSEFESQIRFPAGNTSRRGCQLETVEPTIHGDVASSTGIDQEWPEEEEKDDGRAAEKSSPRQSQVAVTLQWLSENYEKADGVCLPRCVLYQHYLDFCKKMKFTPAGAATFGKIIRQRFPKLTTRRLGTRGQSKYHYYGIGIKETSIYYHSVYSGKGLTRFSGIKLKTEGSSRKYSLSSKTGTLLPEFPNAKNLILPAGTDLEKMRTFIMMYRTHCQRILDTIISANFEEVQNFLVHFWQGMPEHLVDLLHCSLLSDIIALCDSILYKVLVDVLIPSSIQELPQSLYGEMRMFTKYLPYWLETSMETVPEHIQQRKIEVAKSFIQSLKRQSSFVHLAQTARSVIMNQETVSKIVKDISNVDFVDICSQAGFMDPSANPKFCMKMQDFYDEFKELLSKQSSIENYTEWIDDIIDKCVIKPSDNDPELFKDKAAEFLLHWGAFGGLLMRELTLQNASTFASIHLVHLTLDEYAFLVIETQQEAEVEKLLQRAVQRHMKNAEEIQTKAVVRNASNKGMHSPKYKKKRTIEDIDHETSIQTSDSRAGSNNDLSTITNDHLHNGTAFSRPLPTHSKDIHIPENSAENNSAQRLQNGTISVPPVKPYQPYSNTFDRPTYLPHYTDYVGVNPPFSNARFSNYSDTYNQAFPTTHFGSNLSPVAGNYWTDGRTHHSLSDPYQSYNYNKLNATYDSLNKTTLLRNNAYHETINRQAFDPARSYYRGPHDNLQVGPQLQMGAYGTNFMDIAPPAGQYCYQDELFPATMATTFGKSFLSTPFR